MSNLLQDLLAMKRVVTEDEAAPVAKQEEPANPVSAEPVAADAAPAAPAPAADGETKDEVVEEDAEYADSSEFTDEFYSLFEKLEEVKKVTTSQKFKHWMSITDENYSTKLTEALPKLEQDIAALEATLKAFEEMLESAG